MAKEAFERLHNLAPSEYRTAEFTVNPCDLEIYLEKAGKKRSNLEPTGFLLAGFAWMNGFALKMNCDSQHWRKPV